MTEDAREKLATLIYKTKPFLTGLQAKEIADAILAAFPELTTPSGNEAVGAANEIMEIYGDQADNPNISALAETALVMARYILSLAPDKDVVEGARELVATSEYICGLCGGPLPNPDCGHAKNGVVGCCVPSADQPLVDRIAAFATACVAREREACAKIADRVARDSEIDAEHALAEGNLDVERRRLSDQETAMDIAAAIRARTP